LIVLLLNLRAQLADGQSCEKSMRQFAVKEESHDDEAPEAAVQVSRRTAIRKMGRYHVLRLLGEGGMGAVFEAFDPVLARKVAIKVLHAPSASHDQATNAQEHRARLMREARSLAKLAHPNIVAIFDVGMLEDQSVFIAMEYIAGQTLKEILREKKVSREQALDYVMQAAKGLAAAHDAGLLHRDFKPENIMIGDDGGARVLDFGLSKLANLENASIELVPPLRDQDISFVEPSAGEDDSHDSTRRVENSATESAASQMSSRDEVLTQAGTMMGTPAYMAPEQIRRLSLDERADIFALACVFFETVNHSRPFPAQPLSLRLQAISREHPKWKKQAPTWLRLAIARGLRSDAALRWPSVHEFLAAIEEGLELAKRRKKHRRTLALALVATIGIAAWWLKPQAEVDPECRDASPQVDEIWNPARRQSLIADFAKTKLNIAEQTAARVVESLEAWHEGWRNSAQLICPSKRTALELPAMHLALRQQSRACLAESRAQVQALLQSWTAPGMREVLAAIEAVDSIIEPESCVDIDFLERRKPLPENPTLRRYVLSQLESISSARTLITQANYEGAAQALKKIDELRGPGDNWQVDAEFSATAAELAYNANGRGIASSPALLRAEALATAADMAEVEADVMEKLWFARIYSGNYREESLELLNMHAAVIERSGQKTRLGAAYERNHAIWNAMHRRFDEAMAHLEKSLVYSKSAYGEKSPQVAHTLQNLGVTAQFSNDLVASEQYYRAALEITKEIRPKGHPLRSRRYYLLGTILDDLGLPEEGLRTALIGWRECVEADMPTEMCLELQTSFASHAAALGNFTLALQTQEADPDSETTNAEQMLLTLFDRGEVGIAAQLSQQKLLKMRAEEGAHPISLVPTMTSVAEILVGAERFAEAQILLNECEELLRVPTEDGASLIAELLQVQARLALARGRNAQALVLLERLLENAGASRRSAMTRAHDRLLYAQALLALGAYAIADDEARHALLEHESVPGLRAHRKVAFYETLAKIALARAHFAEALQYIEHADLSFDPVQVLDNRRAPLDFIAAQAWWGLDPSAPGRAYAIEVAKRGLVHYEDWDAGAERKIAEVRAWLRAHSK
jgi:serine/threonine-protein kinase